MDSSVNPVLKKEEAEVALRKACWDGNVAAAKEVLAAALETGLDVNARERSGQTALFMACHTVKIEILEGLLAVPGIDVNCCDSSGLSPLSLASLQNRPTFVKLLLEMPGIDVHSVTKSNETVLIHSCISGSEEITRALLAAGVSANVVPTNLETALHLAAFFGNSGCVRALVETPGTLLDPRNRRGRTPLHEACWNGKAVAAATLIAAGASLNVVDVDGRTPCTTLVRKAESTSLKCY